MPPVSEKQRRAMFAAAASKSTLGIPKKVGTEFTQADPGGKLPQAAPKMHPMDSRRHLGKKPENAR